MNAFGTVNSSAGRLGNFATGQGTGLIQGTNARWEINATGASGLSVGNMGTGNLTIQQRGWLIVRNGENTIGRTGTSNGTVTVQLGGRVNTLGSLNTIGESTGSMGTLNVLGNTSTWTSNSALQFGREGTGVLNVLDGGVVTSTSGILGQDFDNSGGNKHWKRNWQMDLRGIQVALLPSVPFQSSRRFQSRVQSPF